ncbi:hypothetical protein NMD99_04120 [Wolbachia endosymbiont of Listronotus oregonensis]|nr:hypothetical protein [Wolbachia endosymbiont of Listronotus oregonensis]WMT83872.1 hypothetical protein NMD99_04120 [Wolbachia endosymbiont of Listronotus oregonensis]
MLFKEESVEDVCIDNKTFYMKFSKDSTVKPVEVLEGARRLGLTQDVWN